MSASQYGFRVGRNIYQCKADVFREARRLVEATGAAVDRVDRPRMFFGDLKNAYDKVNRSKLYRMLAER